MKSLLSVILITFSIRASSVELEVGDILLQPLSCWSCSLIEAEENSIYSHSGLVVSTHPLLIAESISVVHAISFNSFNAKTKKGHQLKVIRLKDKNSRERLKVGFFERFRQNYQGLKFDSAFLWDNVDSDGRELLYCSEFIAKILEAHTGILMPVKRMQYLHNRDYWTEYFSGRIPDGEWGNSPADFDKSPLFKTIGYL